MTNEELLSRLPELIELEGTWSNRQVRLNRRVLQPKRSQGVYNHSPDGFNWGYGGSGPAQLALAILLKYWPAHDAVRWHQVFKWDAVATLPQNSFRIELPLRQTMRALMDLHTKPST